MKLRPKQGQVLVELIPYENHTAGGLELPDNVKHKDEIGRMPGQRAKVLSLGVWPTTKKGHLIPYEFKVGDVVVVDPTAGSNLTAEHKHWKLYDYRSILGTVSV